MCKLDFYNSIYDSCNAYSNTRENRDTNNCILHLNLLYILYNTQNLFYLNLIMHKNIYITEKIYKFYK